MSWMPITHRVESRADQTKEAILASVHRALLLASASRRLQDSISSRRASTEARRLLTTVKQLCAQTPNLENEDERVRVALGSLARALDPEE